MSGGRFGLPVIVLSGYRDIGCGDQVDQCWLATGRWTCSGADRLLAQVVQMLGAAQPAITCVHHRRGNRLVLCCMMARASGWHSVVCIRAVSAGKPVKPRSLLTRRQFDALVLGLPWQQLGMAGVIRSAVVALSEDLYGVFVESGMLSAMSLPTHLDQLRCR